MSWKSSGIASFLIALATVFLTNKAYGLPAFALRESAPCTLCHVNGSAPHLTQYGFMYRRAGYRNPAMIGNAEPDKTAMNLTYHTAVGTNFDYVWSSAKDHVGDPATTTSNQFDVREIEIWPLVGAFDGNIGVFSELDAAPVTASQTPTGSTTGGGIQATHAELVYALGDSDLFFTLRGGLITSQGYGASDQWLDDGNLPLIDLYSAQYNQDTLVTPLGANNVPQVGTEVGAAVGLTTYVTLGAYNGYDGTNGQTTGTQSSLNPVVNHGNGSGVSDYKLQLDQFFGSSEVTGIYYRGAVSLLDPTNTTQWQNHFSTWRLYATQPLTDSTDLFLGAANGEYEYINADTSTGNFTSGGEFIGFTNSFAEHLTLSGRYDRFEYSSFQGTVVSVNGASVMVGVPMGNALVNLHYNVNRSDLDGLTRDVRAEWRLIF